MFLFRFRFQFRFFWFWLLRLVENFRSVRFGDPSQFGSVRLEIFGRFGSVITERSPLPSAGSPAAFH